MGCACIYGTSSEHCFWGSRYPFRRWIGSLKSTSQSIIRSIVSFYMAVNKRQRNKQTICILLNLPKRDINTSIWVLYWTSGSYRTSGSYQAYNLNHLNFWFISNFWFVVILKFLVHAELLVLAVWTSNSSRTSGSDFMNSLAQNIELLVRLSKLLVQIIGCICIQALCISLACTSSTEAVVIPLKNEFSGVWSTTGDRILLF